MVLEPTTNRDDRLAAVDDLDLAANGEKFAINARCSHHDSRLVKAHLTVSAWWDLPHDGDATLTREAGDCSSTEDGDQEGDNRGRPQGDSSHGPGVAKLGDASEQPHEAEGGQPSPQDLAPAEDAGESEVLLGSGNNEPLMFRAKRRGAQQPCHAGEQQTNQKSR